MPRWFHARTIVEEPEAQKEVTRLCKNFPRFGEAFEALKWLLARKGEELKCKKRTLRGVEYRLYRQAADDLADTPEIIILYTCDDDEITIIDVKAEEAEAEID